MKTSNADECKNGSNRPVILCFSASEAFDATYPTNVVVTSEGLCTYIPPGIFMSSCPIDITWFPFDDQNCEMKFGSWTYNGFKVISIIISCSAFIRFTTGITRIYFTSSWTSSLPVRKGTWTHLFQTASGLY